MPGQAIAISGKLGHMFVLVFFDEDTEDLHHRGERVIFVFADLVDEPVEQLHELTVFPVVVRRMASGLLYETRDTLRGVTQYGPWGL